MADNGDRFIQAMRMRLAEIVDAETASTILDAMCYELRDYEITRKSTEIVPYEGDNVKVIKSYIACIIVEGKAKSTAKQYHYHIKKMFDFLGNKRYDEITSRDIMTWLASLKIKGNNNRTVSNNRNCVSAFFKWLYRESLIEKNPLDSIQTIKVPEEELKAFSSEEVDTIRSACKKPVERAMVEMLLSSGLRVSELCNLKLEDIDFNGLTIYVKCGKGGKDRTTYFTPVARKYLRKYLKDNRHESEYVFTNHFGNQYTPGGIRRKTSDLAERCQIHIHPHRFRRTLATDLAEKGMPIQEIQKLLGHTSIETTRKYIEVRKRKIEASYRQYVA